jgi:DNA-binding LacI/PurR family transcriptional regulator
MLTPALTVIERPSIQARRLTAEMLIQGLADENAPHRVPATPVRKR